jgi:D-arabinose 1-dehydrogenase-like Zn-dependent alcohol dehydrogenase
VRFARALGAEVVAFDPDATKRDLVHGLGASELVDACGPLPAAAVDLLLVTTHASLAWDAWLRVLDLEGTLCLVGVPGAPLHFAADPLMDEQKKMTGSVIGSPATMRRMLALAAAQHIAPIVEHMPLARANEAIERVRSGAARMRVVLDVA